MTKQSLLNEAKRVYAEFLKKNRMFFTKERETLLSFIFEQKRHFSVDELMFEMRKADKKISRATLYRSLNQLVEAGILSEAPDFGHGHTHYEILLGSSPHVHLICQSSGKVKEVQSKALEKALNELAKEQKFDSLSYKLQIFGIDRETRKQDNKTTKKAP